MTRDDELAAPGLPRLVQVGVGRYKNLAGVWIDWSDAIVLFGPNGAGKSNVLEALTVLFGSEDSMSTLGQRALQGWSDLVGVIIDDPSAEPGTPEAASFLASVASETSLRHDHERVADWWNDVDPAWNGTLGEWLRVNLTEPEADAWSAALANGAVRYELLDVDVAADGRVVRRFGRTLMTARGEPLDAVTAELPAGLRPESGRGVGPPGWRTVLRLPDSSTAPVAVQYLARRRSAEEQIDALDRVLAQAKPRVERLLRDWSASDFGSLVSSMPPDYGEAEWWLKHDGAAAASTEVQGLFPELAVSPAAIYSNGFDFFVTHHDREIDLVSGANDLTPQLSSSQARWVDEAFAAAASAVRISAAEADEWRAVLSVLPESQAIEALQEIADEIELRVTRNEHWSVNDLDQLRSAFRPIVAHARQRLLIENLTAARALDAIQGLGQRTHPRVMRLVDEPESNLDLRSQRRALEHLRSRVSSGEAVAIASHSPLFLDASGFDLVSFAKPRNRMPRTASLTSEQRQRISRQMGFRQGALLTSVNSVLIVEGTHDRTFLEYLGGLDEFGCAVVRMSGTDNAEFLQTASIDFVDHYLDVPVAVLLDNVRLQVVRSARLPSRSSKEERLLWNLLHREADVSRAVTPFGLQRPDIANYLPTEIVQERTEGRFTSWDEAGKAFKVKGDDSRFKPWFQKSYGMPIDDETIRSLLMEMQRRQMQPEGDLPAVIDRIRLWASDASAL